MYCTYMRKKPKKMGRPPKRKADLRTERVMVYLTKAERKELGSLATEKGIPLATFIMSPWRKGKK